VKRILSQSAKLARQLAEATAALGKAEAATAAVSKQAEGQGKQFLATMEVNKTLEKRLRDYEDLVGDVAKKKE
jgi:hypothetical protein